MTEFISRVNYMREQVAFVKEMAQGNGSASMSGRTVSTASVHSPHTASQLATPSPTVQQNCAEMFQI